jgi:hypothetical protein
MLFALALHSIYLLATKYIRKLTHLNFQETRPQCLVLISSNDSHFHFYILILFDFCYCCFFFVAYEFHFQTHDVTLFVYNYYNFFPVFLILLIESFMCFSTKASDLNKGIQFTSLKCCFVYSLIDLNLKCYFSINIMLVFFSFHLFSSLFIFVFRDMVKFKREARFNFFLFSY